MKGSVGESYEPNNPGGPRPTHAPLPLGVASAARQIAIPLGSRRRRCRWRRSIWLRDGTGSRGKSSRFAVLTQRESGLSVFGWKLRRPEIPARRKPSRALAGGLCHALRVRKPAHAILEHRGWRGDAAPPVEPSACRAAGGAADARGRGPRTPSPVRSWLSIAP